MWVIIVRFYKIVLGLRDRHVFKEKSSEILNIFNTLTLQYVFRKTKTLFKNLMHGFLVESKQNFSFKSQI